MKIYSSGDGSPTKQVQEANQDIMVHVRSCCPFSSSSAVENDQIDGLHFSHRWWVAGYIYIYTCICIPRPHLTCFLGGWPSILFWINWVLGMYIIYIFLHFIPHDTPWILQHTCSVSAISDPQIKGVYHKLVIPVQPYVYSIHINISY